jgi:hypothetical protein
MVVVVLSRAERREAALALRRLLAAVEDGTLSADGPAAVAVVRRLEGVLIALEVGTSPKGKGGPPQAAMDEHSAQDHR